jgi:hypothetical protein
MPLPPESPIRFLKRLLWWLPATTWGFFWEVLWEGYRVWLPLMAFVICGLTAVVWPCPVERAVRLMGMFLQLLGVITIVLRLRAAQRQFPGQTLGVWLQRRPRFRHTVTSATLMANDSADTASFRDRVGPGPQATLEQRVAILEDSYTKLFDEVGGLGKELRQRADELSNKLHDETSAREARDKMIEEQLRETAVGSLHLDAWGCYSSFWALLPGQFLRRSPRRWGPPGASKRPAAPTADRCKNMTTIILAVGRATSTKRRQNRLPLIVNQRVCRASRRSPP